MISMGKIKQTQKQQETILFAEQGNPIAQFNLGLMYDNGEGVPQDYQAAVKWYTLAAKQGDVDARFNLGVMYAKGQGVPQDYKAAIKWWVLSAKQAFAEVWSDLKWLLTKKGR